MKTFETILAGLIICILMFIASCGRDNQVDGAPPDTHIITRYEVVVVTPSPTPEATEAPSPPTKLLCHKNGKSKKLHCVEEQ